MYSDVAMEYLQYEPEVTRNKRKRNVVVYEEGASPPSRQRNQANARERDRTHRWVLWRRMVRWL